MRFVLKLLLVLCLVIISSIVVTGQDTLSACTPEQLITLQQTIVEFIETIPDQDDSLEEISQWQREAWQRFDALEDLPVCLDTLKVLPDLARVADQVLVIKLAWLAGETELTRVYERDTAFTIMILQNLVSQTPGLLNRIRQQQPWKRWFPSQYLPPQ